MASISIRNFGPIKDTRTINLTSVLVVIGRQSSGKSTFMKVLCHCRWVEKNIMTHDNAIQKYTHNRLFWSELKQFHRIDEMYLQEDTVIEYNGDVINIKLSGENKMLKSIGKMVHGLPDTIQK